jgi:hypothetical protein
MPLREYPFPIDAKYSAIAIGYRNSSYIGDLVLPRTPVGSFVFKWKAYPLATYYTVPQTRVGRSGNVNRVQMRGDARENRVEDFGLEAAIQYNDIKAEPDRDFEGEHTELLTELMLLDREVRVATIAFDPANYAAANVTALAAGSRFSDEAANVPKILLDAVRKPLVKPNTMTIGDSAWDMLRMHPRLVKSVLGSTTSDGAITEEQLARYLKIKSVYVGENSINRSAPGLDAELVPVWGDCVSFTYLNPLAARSGGLTWGMTATFGDKFAGAWDEKNPGVLGSRIVRVGEQIRELSVAPDAGALLTDVL